jgi:hypothetical protein
MFQPENHLLNIGTQKKPRMYLEVKHRLHWFREQCPEGTIETEILHLDLDREVTAVVSEWDENQGRMVKVTKHGVGLAIFKATIKDGKGGIATGTKCENNAAFSDFLEKAETGSIGRALAALGYGTQFVGDELDEGSRVVDAPVDREPRKPSYDPDAPATAQQLDTIRKLYKQLEQDSGDLSALSFGDCAQLLKDLNAQLQSKRKAS